MTFSLWTRRSTRLIFANLAVIMLLVFSFSGRLNAYAASLLQISSDPYTNTSSQHHTEVEPDTFSYGSTIVSAFQVGRFYDGGASDIGWSTSTDGGTTWTHGFLPGITKYQNSGPFDRVSDASVAYDARHNVWLVSSLPIRETPSVVSAGVYVNRSTNGGTVWGNPVAVTTQSNLDKNWTVCDNFSSSPYYGHCYTEWDDTNNGNLMYMSTSTDGGLTWSAGKTNSTSATGLGGQPVVQPSGAVIVPFENATSSGIRSFRSLDGGSTWRATVTVASITDHAVPNLRTEALPSAEVDASGKVYVVWQDCRFISNCTANDIIMTTTTDGVTWTSPVRIPLDGTTSGVDHFTPGIGVDKGTSGSTASLGLTYYYYSNTNCTTSTCQLNIGYASSKTGGSTWSTRVQLAGPMNITWFPNTSQGYMFGDYISTSFSNGTAHGAFSVSTAPSSGVFNAAINTTATGLFSSPLSSTTSSVNDRPVAGAHSDHPLRTTPVIRH